MQLQPYIVRVSVSKQKQKNKKTFSKYAEKYFFQLQKKNHKRWPTLMLFLTVYKQLQETNEENLFAGKLQRTLNLQKPGYPF